MENLPDDALLTIFSYLPDDEDFVVLLLVSRRFRQVIVGSLSYDHTIWHTRNPPDILIHLWSEAQGITYLGDW